MKYEELKAKSNHKLLFYGPSMRGKTRTASTIALELSKEGVPVKYVDTESEGSSTMVNLIEQGDYSEDDVENLDYCIVDSYEGLTSEISEEGGAQDKYGLIVIDTLDHKHTFALKEVTDKKVKSDADWNEYPAIYSAEKQIMEIISKPDTNFLCTFDPESGGSDKPKGAQGNILGFFSVVVRLEKGDEEYAGTIENWIGRSDVVDTTHRTEDIIDKMADMLSERTE